MLGSNRLRRAFALLVAMLCILPPAFLLFLSFAERWAFPDILPGAFGLGAWRGFWSGAGGVGGSILLSALLSFVVAATATIGGCIAGKYVMYHRRRDMLLFLAYLPFVMSPVVLGACIHILYIRLGLVGTVAGVICAQSISAWGFSVIFSGSFWNRERRGLEEVARLLGGSTSDVYRRILFPAARDFLFICFLQTFLFSWFQYGITLLIGAGKVKTLPVLVFMYAGEANIQYAALSSIILILPPILMLWGNRRLMVNAKLSSRTQ